MRLTNDCSGDWWATVRCRALDARLVRLSKLLVVEQLKVDLRPIVGEVYVFEVESVPAWPNTVSLDYTDFH